MKTARRITFNFLSLAGSEIFAKIAQLIIYIALARIFGKLEFGNFGFAIAFSAIIGLVPDFGLNYFLIREISRNKHKLRKYFSNALALKLILSLVAFAAAYGYLNIGGYSAQIRELSYIFVIFMILQSFTDLFYSAFRSFEKMHFDALIKILRMVILSFLVYRGIAKGESITSIAFMFPLTEILVLILSSLIYTKKFAKISIEFDLKFIINLARRSIFFGVSSIFVILLIYIDTVMLERLRGPAEVGLYAAAYNLLLGFTFIPLMYSNAVYPVFSRYFLKDKSLLRFAYKKSYQYMLTLGLPLSIGIYTYADKLAIGIYGPEFAETAVALKILTWFVLFRFVNTLSGTLLSSIDRQGSRVFVQGFVVATNIFLNLMLIPRFGFLGAGIATIISESFFIIFYTYFTLKYGISIGISKMAVKPIIASIAMLIAMSQIENIFIGILSGIASYLVVLLLTRTFNEEDKMLLHKFIKNS